MKYVKGVRRFFNLGGLLRMTRQTKMFQGIVTSAKTPDTVAVKRDSVVGAGTAAQSASPSCSNMSQLRIYDRLL